MKTLQIIFDELDYETFSYMPYNAFGDRDTSCLGVYLMEDQDMVNFIAEVADHLLALVSKEHDSDAFNILGDFIKAVRFMKTSKNSKGEWVYFRNIKYVG